MAFDFEILERIKRNIWSYCSMAERPFKEARPKITIEKSIICNGNIIVYPQTLRKDTLKSVHDDVMYIVA